MLRPLLAAATLASLTACTSTPPAPATTTAADPLLPTSSDPSYRELAAAKAAIAVLNLRRDTAVHNLANISAPGYRARRVVPLTIPFTGESGDDHPLSPRAITLVDMSRGSPIHTGRSLDLLIEGEGFFCFERYPGGAMIYSRAGLFTANADGELVSLLGDHHLQPPIAIPSDTVSVKVDETGQVWVTRADSEPSAEPELAGQIMIVTFAQPDQLLPVGESFFAETPRSGPPTERTPLPTISTIIAGYYENSNVTPEIEQLELRMVHRALMLWGVECNPSPHLLAVTPAAAP